MCADLRYQSSAYIDFANANTIDGFFVANAQIAYRPGKWRFGLHVNNLTNTTYFSSGYTDFDGVNKYFVQAPAHVNTTATRTF
jgi:outer membrane receptor protein involved in Fe transport